jgi:L-histidine N-alpha-methyltransferase
MDRLAPEEIVEIGAGTGDKVRLFLDERTTRGRLRYVPVDVDGETMAAAARSLTERYEFLEVHGVVGDFERHLRTLPAPQGRRVVLFLGSTIGNLDPPARRRFLASVRTTLGRAGRLVLGVDLVKDQRVLEAAYDDRAGVTREFNRNVLRVVNGQLGGDFAPEAFRHVAFYDPAKARIEMHLVPDTAQEVHVRAIRLRVTVKAGESIWTESSYKFTRASLDATLAEAGLTLETWHTEGRGRFAIVVVASRT